MHAMHTYTNTHEHTEGHHCIHPRMMHYDSAYTLTAPYVGTSCHPHTHTSCVRRCQHMQPTDTAIVQCVPRPWHDPCNI